MIILMLVSLYY